jgi:hypothetical protein
MGGWSGGGLLNDVWRSTDLGVSWNAVLPVAGRQRRAAMWSPRWWFRAVVDEAAASVYVIGGLDDSGNDLRDVWRLQM